MKNQVVYSSPAYSSNKESLLITLFVATIFHVILILGVNFTMPHQTNIDRPIDITLVTMPVKKAPKEAKFLAQENQIGAGVKTSKPEPPPQKLPSRGSNEAKQVKKHSLENSEPKVIQKIITQKKADVKVVAETKPAVVNDTEKRPHISAEMAYQQIAQLGTEIRQSQQSSDDTKIKFVDSVSTHKYQAAQYMKDWEDKVERTGNLNYPEVAAKKNFSGTLTMDVGVKADGSIYSIRINKSSGNQALDEAAKRIVKMSAPFPPLPVELLKELNVLVITRVWKFSDESGMTAR